MGIVSAEPWANGTGGCAHLRMIWFEPRSVRLPNASPKHCAFRGVPLVTPRGSPELLTALCANRYHAGLFTHRPRVFAGVGDPARSNHSVTAERILML